MTDPSGLIGPPPRPPKERTEDISYHPWLAASAPERILVIRLHAVGDVAITLPACAALRESLPGARIDFLTASSVAELPETLSIFDKVHRHPVASGRTMRGYHAFRTGSALSKVRYQVVIDLQRNWVTRSIRRMCMPDSWSEFDRFSPFPAGERVLDTFLAAGFEGLSPFYAVKVNQNLILRTRQLMMSLGWDGVAPLICLNPAGLWKTRNWPLSNYAELAALWLRNEPACFVLIGNERISAAGKLLSESIPGGVINLIEKTSLAEAFAVVQQLSFMISEDSGLMHMAWVSGVPTVALFGSSRHDWSSPLGPRSRTFHSGDLACGACMLPECQFGDVRCLSRHTPESVLRAIEEIRRMPSEPGL